MIATRTCGIGVALLSMQLVGCGSDVASAPAGALVRASDEPAGAHCAEGGVRLDTGVDHDASGALDDGEVSATSYVCRGASGANGANGTHGTNGVDGTNGANGDAGANGTSTSASVLAITTEPAGPHCAYGGSKIAAGPDANGDGVLQPSEVTSTQYVCSGAPAGLPWVNVVTTTVQAAPNTGYLAASAARVVVTLPKTPALGDIVRVDGIGSGGFAITPNLGQFVTARGLGLAAGVVWTQRAPAAQWGTISCARNGSLIAVGDMTEALFLSRDRGMSWTRQTSFYGAVAVSSDGQRVLVAGGQTVLRSTDGGTTFGFVSAVPVTQTWWSLAGSDDLGKVVAAQYSGVFTSSNLLTTWTDRHVAAIAASVASSADGVNLAVAGWNDRLRTSSDAGATWTDREQQRNWTTIASSSDGSRLVAAGKNERIYTSSDSGLTWTPRENVRWWAAATSSSDGKHLAAAAVGGPLFISSDGGVTWVPRARLANWTGICSTGDGGLLVAIAGEGIYTSEDHVESGPFATIGAIIGDAHESIELQYIGGGVFNVVSSSGFFEVP